MAIAGDLGAGGRIGARPAAASGRTGLLLVFGLLLPLAVVPILTTAHPPLFDYPNHLSRAHVLAGLDAGSPFALWFLRESFFIPNVGTDLILVSLVPLVGAEAAGRILLLAIAAGTLGGAVTLGRVVAGRTEPWPAFASVFLFGEMLHWGFLNYLFGVALLLWGIAAVIAAGRRSRGLQLAVTAAFAVVILFCHLVAFGLFAVAAAAIELAAVLAAPGLRPLRSHRTEIARRFAWIAAGLLPAVVLHLVATWSSGLPFAPLVNYTLFEKLAPYTRVLSAGEPVSDAAVTVAVAVLLGGLALGRRIAADRRIAIAAAGFFACQLVLPYSMMHSFFVDNRIAIATVLVLLAGLRTLDPAVERTAWILLLLILAVRTVTVTQAWWTAEDRLGEVLASFEPIAPGDVLIPTTVVPFEYGTGWFYTRSVNPPVEHVASWATIRENAVVPSIFAKHGQNPLVFDPPSPTLRRIALGPIGRATDVFDRRQLTRNAVATRAGLDRIGLAGVTVYVAVFGVTCRELDFSERLKPLFCGRRHVLLEAERRCPAADGPRWCGNTTGPAARDAARGDEP